MTGQPLSFYKKPPAPEQPGDRWLDENQHLLPEGCWVAATDRDGLLASDPDVDRLRLKLPEEILADKSASYTVRFIPKRSAVGHASKPQTRHHQW